MIQRTLVLIKPDGVQRALIGECIRRFENAGLKLVGMKLVNPSEDFTKKHYAMHKEHKFYDNIIKYISNKLVVAIVLEGSSAVEVVRKIVGTTEPKTALPGTIRGDLCHQSYTLGNTKGHAAYNLVHASGTPEEAEQEINLWFTNEELHTYARADDEHIV